MLRALRGLSKTLGQINAFIGRYASWLSTALVLLICSDVFMRYFLDSTRAWVLELEWHLFALLFLLAAAYTFREDQHVRVDVFYVKRSPKQQAWINLTGTLFLLIPWCLIIIVTSFSYAENAFAIRETSPDPGGLPARYLIKFAITIGFTLLLLQGISEVIKSILLIIRNKKQKI